MAAADHLDAWHLPGGHRAGIHRQLMAPLMQSQFRDCALANHRFMRHAVIAAAMSSAAATIISSRENANAEPARITGA
jgi:hypothetical protein